MTTMSPARASAASEPAAPRDEATVVAGRDPEGRRLPPLRERLCPPMPKDVLLGWLGPIAIAVFAGILRVVNLGYPAKFVFDETYYPKDAFSLLKFGVEHQFLDKANERILAGDFDVFGGAAFIVHPPMGKWVMAAGEAIFGMNSFGWRIGVAVLGMLSVLVIARVVRRMTRSTLLGCIAAFLLSLDGLHFVESRIALIDLPAMFWMLLGFACLLIDRDWMRNKLLLVAEPTGRVGDAWGPTLRWRPWRLAAGLCLGLACATKWNSVFLLAMLGLATFAWDIGARRAVGVRLLAAGSRAFVAGRLALDAVVAFVTVVGTVLATYIASWAGWFASNDGYQRNWAKDNPATGLWVLLPDSVRSLLHYHAEMLDFHTRLTDSHPYASNPWGWLVIARPVSFDWVDKIGPSQGCPTDRCIQEILGIGTPVLWWAGIIALLACVVFWLAGRDWRFGLPVIGVIATWLPWLKWSDRPIFYFYAIAILPWLVIGVTLVLGKVLGQRNADPERRMWGAALVGGFVLLVLLNFAYLYPILTDQVIPYDDWLARMWFGSWV